MTREIVTGVSSIDQFPAFESNGVSKRSGLSGADFSTTVYRDGAVVALPVTITPATGDPGEYKTVFTPNANGFFELHVLIIFSGDIRFARYNSVTTSSQDLLASIKAQARKIDLAPTLTPSAVNSGSLMDRIMNQSGDRTYDPATDSLEALGGQLNLVTDNIDRILGLLHQNAIVDNQTYDVQGQLLTARLRVFDSAGNVPLTAGGDETTGLLHEYTIESVWDGLNHLIKYVLKKVT